MPKCNVRRKAQLGLDIREGGIAIPIANNMFYIDGRKHAAGGVAIGPNNKNGVEVEGGEVVEMIDSNHPSVGRQFKAGGQQQTMRIFSSVPFLRGVSPAQLVMEGANPDTVFKAQEEFKDRNRINDDGTTYQTGGQKKSNSAIRTEADKKVPAYNRAVYSLVDPTMAYPTKKEAFGYAIGAGIKAMRNPNDMVYWVTDSVSDAAWRKRHGLSYDNKFLIPNEDGSVRLPKDREMEIPTDTTMLKNRIATNEKLAKRYPEGSEKRDIVDWALKVDGMALDSLRHTYRTGEPVTINEGAYNSRRLINNGELSYPVIMPHNVMQNYAIQYDKSKDKMNYWDTYNFNQFEWGVPGKPFEIKGSIPLKKAGGIYIKPSKRGTFTAAATKHGMGVQEFASKVLANKEDYSPAMVKKANFARNASRWKKEYGGNKNVLPELIVTPRNGYNKIYDASGINKRKKIAQDVLQILPFSGFVNDVLGFINPINAGGAVKSAMGYVAAKAGLPFLSIPGIAFNGALGLPDLIQDVQTLYKDIKTPKEEFNKNKKEFGGSMIYTINGNVKNGLSLRPKAEWGKGKDENVWRYKTDPKNFVRGYYQITPYGRIDSDGKSYIVKNGKNVFNTFPNFMNEAIKYQANKRPQYYAEKRLPIAGSQSIAEKVGLARSGWSYGQNPTFDYVPNINLTVPENYSKGVASSTPRGKGTKASTTKAASQSTPTIQDAVNKITMDAWKASKTPKIDLSKAKMPTYNVNDLGSKESRAAKAKLNTSSTGGIKETPWVPQYNLINTRDWIGVGTNLAGHIASYFANNALLKKAPMPTKPVQFQAAKLKTTHNINPDLANINEVTQMNLAEVGRNTASSNTSIARKQRIMNEARDARNKLYGQKENIETQLINLDRRNRQDVYNRNIAAYNDWLDKTYIAKSNNLVEKQRNLNNLISGIPMAVNTMLGTIENRKSTNDMIRAIAAANPNVDGRLFGIGDYYSQKLPDGRTAIYNKNHKLVKYV